MSRIVCNFVQLHLSQWSCEEEVRWFGALCIALCTVQCTVHWSLVRRRWVEVGGG